MAITQITMKNLNDMNVVNAEANIEYGFFFVEFEGGKSLQCCLVHNGEGFEMKINSKDSGFDQGLSYDCNEWAAGEDGEIGHIEDFLLEQAREIGLQIV